MAACLLLLITASCAHVGDWETHMSAGMTTYEQGRYGEAEAALREAVAAAERFGADDPRVAAGLNALANVYVRDGRSDQAEVLYRRALRIREAALGPNHPDVATIVNNLAGLATLEGRFAEGGALYTRALEIREKALGRDDPSTAVVVRNLAGLYVSQARYAEAEPFYRRVLTTREQALADTPIWPSS
jgi:tetratricopeptide (TPR) repeat protein